MQQYLTVITAIASVFFLAWAFVVHPSEASDDHDVMGKQLVGLLLIVLVLAGIGALVIIILPYVGMIAMTVLGIIIGLALVAFGWFVLRPLIRDLFPRLRKFMGFMKRQTGRLLRVLWRAVRSASRFVVRLAKWVAHPERWRRTFARIISVLRRSFHRLKNAFLSIVRAIRRSLLRMTLILAGLVKKTSSAATDAVRLPEDPQEEEHASLLALELDAD